jgi:hypothetical protein
MVQNPAAGALHSHMCCTPPSRTAHAMACADVHKSNPGRAPKPCAVNHNNINADPLATAGGICTGVSSLAVSQFKIVYTAMDKSCVRALFEPALSRSLSLSLSVALVLRSRALPRLRSHCFSLPHSRSLVLSHSRTLALSHSLYFFFQIESSDCAHRRRLLRGHNSTRAQQAG